jgi:hypothetical protein
LASQLCSSIVSYSSAGRMPLGNRNGSIGNRGPRLPCLSIPIPQNSDQTHFSLLTARPISTQHEHISRPRNRHAKHTLPRGRLDAELSRSDEGPKWIGMPNVPQEENKGEIHRRRSAYKLTVSQCTGERPTCMRCERLRQQCKYGDDLAIGDAGYVNGFLSTL